MTYQHYIKSEEWYQLKIDLLNKRGCKCEKCGIKKRPTSLHIHHISYERLFNEKPEDLMILCPICHMKEHGLIKKKIYKPRKHKKQRKYKPKVSKQRQHLERQANEKFIAQQRKKHKNYSIYK